MKYYRIYRTRKKKFEKKFNNYSKLNNYFSFMFKIK